MGILKTTGTDRNRSVDAPRLVWDRVAARWQAANPAARHLVQGWHRTVTPPVTPDGVGPLPPPPDPSDAGRPAHAGIWDDFARWCPTGLMVISEPCHSENPLARQVIGCNDAAGALLGAVPAIGTSIERVLGERLDAEQRDALEAALAGWGPQVLRIGHGHLTLRVSVHRQPGGIVLGLEDASLDVRIESTLDAQARALDAREREVDALMRGLSRRLGAPLGALRHVLAAFDDGLPDEGPLRVIHGRLVDVDVSLRRNLDVLFELTDITFDETTSGRVDMAAVAASTVCELAAEADALGVRLVLGALPTIRGVRREVALLLQMLMRHGLYDRAPGTDCVLKLSCCAVRGGWRFVLGEVGADLRADAPAAEMDAVTDFHLAVCRRILRRRGGRLGRLVGADGERAIWFEWPGRAIERRAGD